MKKIMSLCLAVCLVVLCLPLHASAEMNAQPWGKNLYYTFDKDTGTLTISGTGAMENFDEYGRPHSGYYSYLDSPLFFGSNGNVKTLIVESGVTSIGAYAFYNCREMTEVQLPDTLTEINHHAFYYCTQLSKVTLPNHLATIQGYAFKDCSALKELNCAGAGHLTSIGNYAFENCTALQEITLPDQLTSIGNYTFQNCTALQKITLSKHLTSIGEYAFQNCSALQEIALPDTLEHLGPSVFSDCGSLKAIHVGAGSRSFSSRDGILFNKTEDQLICYPAAKSGVEYTVPNTVTSIAPSAFHSTAFERIILPEHLTELGAAAFAACKSMKEFTLPEQFSTVPWGLLSDCTSLEKVTLHQNVTAIGAAAFRNCISLSNIELPNSIETIDFGAFCGCERITDVKVPTGLKKLGAYAFQKSGISSAVIPEGVPAILEHTFEYCTNLKEVRLPDGITSIGVDAFSMCSSLESIELKSGLKALGFGCFFGTGLKTIKFPDGMTTLDRNMFHNYAANLETLYLPGSLTHLDSDTLYDCTNLKDVYFDGPKSQWETYDAANAVIFPDAIVHCTDGDIQYEAEPYTYFEDVRRGAYFCAAVNWAKENGITLGTSDTEFSPGRSCSRAQIVTFLWRAKGSPDPTNAVSPFSDVQNPEVYFYKPVIWAAENNITLGDGTGRFSPGGDCTRAQMVTFLWRSAGCPAPTNSSHAFTDVDPDAYYYDPMLWAVEQGITVGTTDTTFGPDELCTRAQAVTFLYRAAQV